MADNVTKRFISMELIASVAAMLVTVGIAWGALNSAQGETDDKVQELKKEVKETKQTQQQIKESIGEIKADIREMNVRNEVVGDEMKRIRELLEKKLTDYDVRDRR